MKKIMRLVGMVLAAAALSGCAGGFGLVRIMEPPLKDIDTAELAANLPEGKALDINYSFESVQPKSSLKAGNDANLNLANITDLISYGASIKGAEGTAKAFADIANKDRRIGVHITIADSADILAMRQSDNDTRLVQQGKSVDVGNRATVTEIFPPVVSPPVVTEPPVVIQTNSVDPVIPTPGESNSPLSSLDALDIRSAQLLGTWANVNPARAEITKLLTRADVQNGLVMMNYETLGWPEGTPIGGDMDGRVYIFWKEGNQVVGGHFDWKGPGQTSKTLENVFDGYLSGHRPRPGDEVWFCLVKVDGTERTNVIKSNEVWP